MLVPTPSEIAEREERRIAIVLRELGGDGAPIGGGWMACDLPGSWADYAAGLGLDGPVDDSTLDEFLAFYRKRNRSPRIHVTPFQHPTLLSGLEARGFTVYEQENILVRLLDELPPINPIPGLVFRLVDPSNDDDVYDFRCSHVLGFCEGKEPPQGVLPITDRVARSQRCKLWLLELDGAIVGSGGLEFFEDAAVLIAGCVNAEARCKGLHSAFIRFRLQQAKKAGVRYVTVGSILGGPTERNALRAGFSVAYLQTGLSLKV